MGCNPDILENIVQGAGDPRDIYFPIYPDYNPCTNIIHRRKIVHKTDIYNVSYSTSTKIWSLMQVGFG